MPHKYQIMTNLIFTMPLPYADEGIIAGLALQGQCGGTMTTTSNTSSNFGMQSSWCTAHGPSAFKAQSIPLPGICDGSVFCRASHQAPRKRSKLTCKRLCWGELEWILIRITSRKSTWLLRPQLICPEKFNTSSCHSYFTSLHCSKGDGGKRCLQDNISLPHPSLSPLASLSDTWMKQVASQKNPKPQQ